MIQQRRLTLLGFTPQPLNLLLSHPVPGASLLPVNNRRRAVHVAVQPIYVMSKFVDHEVAPRPNLLRIDNLRPRQDHRPAMPGLAQPRTLRSEDLMLIKPAGVRDVAGRVDNDRLQSIEVIGLVEPQRHHTGITGDRDLHLVAQFESASANPILFGRHDLDSAFQPLALLLVQVPIMPHTLAQNPPPLVRKRLAEQPLASTRLTPRAD